MDEHGTKTPIPTAGGRGQPATDAGMIAGGPPTAGGRGQAMGLPCGRTPKKLGVIGGMGPAATLMFYDMMIRHTAAGCDQEHIDMVILNHASMPDRTKLLKEGRGAELLSQLSDDARMLEACGVDAVLMTCNTSHVLAGEIQAAIGVPLLDMIDAAVREYAGLHGASPAKAAVLATDGTIESGVYQRALGRAGVPAYVPSQGSQRLIMKLIYDGVKGGGELDIGDFRRVEAELAEAGCGGAILACTELSVLKRRWGLPGFYLDAMLSLAKAAIQFAGCEYKDA
ncbi:MAG: amino acid racemase [Clostridiales Family XIII bacterium]|nr:amino acid racemase [Clostridiales Family XIII bacterium]